MIVVYEHLHCQKGVTEIDLAPCKQTVSPQEGAGQVETGDRSFVFLKASQAVSGHISFRAQAAGMDPGADVERAIPCDTLPSIVSHGSGFSWNKYFAFHSSAGRDSAEN